MDSLDEEDDDLDELSDLEDFELEIDFDDIFFLIVVFEVIEECFDIE